MRRSVLVAMIVLLAVACEKKGAPDSVVVYTALDQVFSEPVLEAFEKETGIRVKPVYDTEATKTVGLVNRIVAEASNPQCDVFWNNEISRTVMLKRRGLLEAYASPSAVDIPESLKDREGFWTGFAARARILIYNTNLLTAWDAPASILDLTQPQWRGKVALAYPLFGTTATHAAALFSSLGPDEARDYYERLKANDVVIVDGNATSKDMVARGEIPIGFTDTDDANVALEQGKPVGIVFPDQGEGEMGTLVIPNTVALIKGCPHPEAGKKLIDFLLRRETERMLAHSGSVQMPVRDGVEVPEGAPSLSGIKAMAVNWDEVEAEIDEATQFLGELFVR